VGATEKEALKQELLKALSDGVVEYDEDRVKQAAQQVVDEGLAAYDEIMDGLAAGMELVGELYDEQEYFVPEMILCAEAFSAGLDMLKPHIKSKEHDTASKGQVVIGTVQGDVHDIGKNLYFIGLTQFYSSLAR
jgi:methanogenic corrinoid protein MtbC1